MTECPKCDGRGYTLPLVSLFEFACSRCGGSGMVEVDS